MKRLLGLPLVLLLIAGCELTSSDDALSDQQMFLFQVEYVNYAWGAAWNGLYVDHVGRIYTYDLSGESWTPQSETSFTTEELLAKYTHNKERIDTLDPADLAEQRALIPAAGAGILTEPTPRCADFGTLTFSAFTYDARTDRYTPVLLQQEGDMARTNTSNSAALLVTWLKTLDDARFDNEYCLP
jgi:hypothetical protein